MINYWKYRKRQQFFIKINNKIITETVVSKSRLSHAVCVILITCSAPPKGILYSLAPLLCGVDTRDADFCDDDAMRPNQNRTDSGSIDGSFFIDTNMYQY